MKPLFFLAASLLIAACSNKTIKRMKTTTQMQSGYAPVNGLTMYYEIHGEGAPLVLIHGGGSTIGTSFGRILPLLSEHFRVIAVELQAHGHTSDRNAPESFESDADDVAALLRYLKIDKASFFGFSNGGNTAMQIAIRHPELVNKLVIASAFYKRAGMMPGFFEGLAGAELADMPAGLQEAFRAINKDPHALQAMFEKDRNRMVQFRDWPEEYLQRIKAPALFIAADKDVMTVEHTAEMARHVTNSRLLILPGNHGSYIGEMMTEKPDMNGIGLTLEVIRGFLE